MALDAKDFSGYLAMCDPAYRYAITAYSPEIRKEMTWLEHDHAGMKLLFGNLPKHNSDHSTLSRHVTVYTVTGSCRECAAGFQDDAGRWRDRVVRCGQDARHDKSCRC